MQSFVNNLPELKRIPKTSGLYYFYNGDNKLQYIGKAKNLNQRVIAHQKLNVLHHEGLNLKKQMPKGYEYDKDRWEDDLLKKWKEFEFKMMNKQMLVIDFVFHKITRIIIEEIPYDLIKSKEKEMIQKLEPPLNSEIASDEYERLKEELE